MKRVIGVCGALMLCGCPMAPEEPDTGPTAAAPIPADPDPRNSCRFAFDDECDDGRPGSSTALCELFTDEADCLKTSAENPDNPVPEVVEVPVFVPVEVPVVAPGAFPPIMPDPVSIPEGSAIIADDGKFLGIVSDSVFVTDSIASRFGSFGSRFDTNSIWSRFGTYGSTFSRLSPWNESTQTPPRIYDNSGNFVAYLTANDSLAPSIHPNELALLVGRTDLLR